MAVNLNDANEDPLTPEIIIRNGMKLAIGAIKGMRTTLRVRMRTIETANVQISAASLIMRRGFTIISTANTARTTVIIRFFFLSFSCPMQYTVG